MVDLNQRRRELLYSLVSLAGAGLIKVIWDNQSAGDGLRVSHSAGSAESGATSTFRINEGEFTVWELSFDRPVRFQYSMKVLQGPAIDVILTDDPYPLPEDRSEWRYYPDTSRLAVKEATVTDTLPPGRNYLLVFDNTDRLRAKPPTNLLNDAAIVTFQFDLKPIEVATASPETVEGTGSATPAESPTTAANPVERMPTEDATPTESVPTSTETPTDTPTDTFATVTATPTDDSEG